MGKVSCGLSEPVLFSNVMPIKRDRQAVAQVNVRGIQDACTRCKYCEIEKRHRNALYGTRVVAGFGVILLVAFIVWTVANG